jgi:hypothetical protein
MLEALKCSDNPDMVSEIYGPLLVGDGMKLRLTNIDFLDANTHAHWTSVCNKYGYDSIIKHNVSGGYVTIVCEKKRKYSKLSLLILCTSLILVVHLFNELVTT